MADPIITVDPRDALTFLNTLSSQLPFAESRAINAVANDAQASIRRHIEQTFTLRRKSFILRTIKRNRGTYPAGDFAHKRQAIRSARLRVDDTRDVLAKFETETVKRPRGKALAVPVEARRTKGGIVSKSERIPGLQLTRRKGRLVSLKKGHYVAGPYIFRRLRRGITRLLYVFKPQVPLPPRLRFEEISRDTAQRMWVTRMTQELARALRTAKR